MSGTKYAAHIDPCPFCGHAYFNSRTLATEYVHVSPLSIDGALHVSIDGTGYYRVICCNCHTNGPAYGGRGRTKLTKGPVHHPRDRDKTALAIIKAIDAWNLRESPQMAIEWGEE